MPQPPPPLASETRRANHLTRPRPAPSGPWLFCLGLWFFLLLAFAHQQRFDSPTPVSRLDTLHAWTSARTLCIDRYHHNTPDKAEFFGHYYSDKAPGTTALALPAFSLAAATLEAASIPLSCRTGWLASSWIACAGSIGLITAAGAVALFSWLSRWVQPRTALLTVSTLFLGAAPLPYATLMFSHASVVGWIALALWSLAHPDRQLPLDPSPPPTKLPFRVPYWWKQHRWECLAGLAAGWAVASEYTAGLIAVALGFTALVTRSLTPTIPASPTAAPAPCPNPSRWHPWNPILARGLAFGLGSLPPLLLIPAYSYACFGNPFLLPYSLQASFPQMQEGLYAIRWPDLHTAWRLLFHPAKGLLFWTPFLAIAAWGYRPLHSAHRGLFWLTYLVPIVQWIVISGRVWDWQAGPTLGPRYLAPILPFLALPCALGAERAPRLAFTLAACSVALTTLATLTDACPNYETTNPLRQLHLPLLASGNLSPNLGRLLGLPAGGSVMLFYALLAGGVWALARTLPNHSRESRSLCS